MNKKMKQYLETVVNATVNEDTPAADKAFHQYLRMKTQEILLGEEADEDEDDEDMEKEPKKDKAEGDEEDMEKDEDEDKEDEDEKC